MRRIPSEAVLNRFGKKYKKLKLILEIYKSAMFIKINSILFLRVIGTVFDALIWNRIVLKS